ncbi:hypothetical protein BDW22DRAFT_1356212 [Trametopsis cervina]|nr:hypothetical protein BDW22DRAFT_1356212 [Trametopsis cervina]
MQTILVDDTDPSVLYTGKWVRDGVSSEYNLTTHVTMSEGAAATLLFHGISVQVIGTIGNSAGDGIPVTSYNLDQNQTVFFIAPNNTGSRLSRQPFFTSPTLPDGDHVLTVTLRSNATSFALDYFSVTQYKSSPVTASVPAVPIAISTTTASENAANTAGSQSTGSRLHQPAVLTGIILGAAGFLAVTIAVICMCVRRRRARRGPTADDYPEVNRNLEPSFPPAQTIAHDRALRDHPTHLNSVASGPQNLTMLRSSHPRNVTAIKGVGRHQGGGVPYPRPTYSAQSLDGLTERSLDSRDLPPAYSLLSEHTAGIPKRR